MLCWPLGQRVKRHTQRQLPCALKRDKRLEAFTNQRYAARDASQPRRSGQQIVVKLDGDAQGSPGSGFGKNLTTSCYQSQELRHARDGQPHESLKRLLSTNGSRPHLQACGHEADTQLIVRLAAIEVLEICELLAP